MNTPSAFMMPRALQFIAAALLCILCLNAPSLWAVDTAEADASVLAAQSAPPILDGEADKPRLAGGSEVLGAGALLQLLGGLALVIVLIFVSAGIMRRYIGVTQGAAGRMRVINAISLGARDRLLLVQIGDKQVLLGASPGRINKIHLFDEPVILEAQASESEFARKLQSLLPGKAHGQEASKGSRSEGEGS